MADRTRSRTPVEHLEEPELLERVARNDGDAAKELYRRSAPGAWSLAFVVTGTADDAGTAVREGFRSAMRQLRGESPSAVPASDAPTVVPAPVEDAAEPTTDAVAGEPADETDEPANSDEPAGETATDEAEASDDAADRAGDADASDEPAAAVDGGSASDTARADAAGVSAVTPPTSEEVTARGFRPLMLRATRAAALECGDHLDDHLDSLIGSGASDEVGAEVRPSTDAAAFAELPEVWRSALWLSDVEMMSDEQLAASLDATPEHAEATVARAREALHENVQARLSIDDPECALVSSQLSDLLAGHLDDLGNEAVHEHLAGCEACRERRARLISIADELGAMVPQLPPALERDTLNHWREEVGLPLVQTGRIPIVRNGSNGTTGEHRIASTKGGGALFDMPEPTMERWKRTLAKPGPVAPSRNRRRVVAAAAAALVLAGGIGAAVHRTPSQDVRSALATDGGATGQVVVTRSTTTQPATTTTAPGALAGLPSGVDLAALEAWLNGPSTSVLPAGSGRATRQGGTVPGTAAPTTRAPSTTAASPSTTAPATTTTKPSPPTTARHCITWLLPPGPLTGNGICAKWSS
ncbi:MAG TPA: zf-HC2 domain-containing protein [Acidimicrobiales bacterium]|jgi:DNA-directed RNA polymerase specialized sigma24 family protein|nr:zf-HC2 domain-containing protein [Acidimicrobiales bacterium]